MNAILLSIILIPIIEIYLFIEIGGKIGAINTIALIFLTAIVGIFYARVQGMRTLRSGMINLYKNKTNLNIINNLHKILNIKRATENKKGGVLSNKTFMLTGKLNGISRAEAKSLIEKNSGSIISNVSKKLDYLIIGEKPTNRKIEAAKELNIKIINQSEWLKLINKTS